MSIPKESESIINILVQKEKIKLKDLLKDKADISSRLFKRLIKQDNILVNGKPLGDRFYVSKGDIVTMVLEDEEAVYSPEKISLEIIYEDLDTIVINKPPFILVHPTKNHPNNTITNGVQSYFKSKSIKKKVRLVNRLDRDTSGILVIAKNSYGHQQISRQFRQGIEKRYIAIVNGVMSDDKGIIDLPICKEEDGIKNIIDQNGKEAVTEYKVIERLNDATVLELKIITGRTHQIRVHLAHLGHTIIGDSLYGEESELIKRQSLHSYYLKFNAPRTNEVIELKADLPADMKQLINILK